MSRGAIYCTCVRCWMAHAERQRWFLYGWGLRLTPGSPYDGLMPTPFVGPSRYDA